MQHRRTKQEKKYCKCLSKTIKRLRKEKGISGNCLALDSWIASSTFCRVETNQNTPLITTVAQIAQGLGIFLSELIIEMEKELPKDFSFVEN